MTPALAKTLSHEFCRRNLIEINEGLPPIEALEELCPQNARAIAIRSVVLGYVIGIGFGADSHRLKKSMEAFGLFEHASAKEQAALSKSQYSQQERINATWLTECVQSLAWCLGLVELDPFRRCDDDLANHFPQPFTDPSGFLVEAKLRPLVEVYQQADLYYRLHWAARNARLTGQRSSIDEEVISERRKALDWAIGVETDWDEVSLDT